MQFGRRGGDGGFGGVGAVARPICNGATGATDNGNKGRDIPRVHDGVDSNIYKARGEHEVAVTIGPGAVEPSLLDESVARRAVLIFAKIEVITGHQGRLVEFCGRSTAGRFAVERGGLVIANGELPEGRLIDGAEDGLAVVE